ncbi:predicted protein [Plenodomus lingam JN3]|uniref:Predicted protein n=2 Tax=Leptosphaeria maculans TaxID=5022 RepID=E5A8I3_LEPMJ|nr:predicted protein [Plenodomus lingam JN3]CBX99928.1 predicted protein [Plenodomus lingam JN3]
MSCPLLQSLKSLPTRALFTLASSIISYDEINKAKDEESGVINDSDLAERAYYGMGDKLLAQGDFNEMTRLHMQRALQERGWVKNGEEVNMTDWKLRLRLFSMTRFTESQAKEQAKGAQAKDSASESESIVRSHSNSSEDTVG